MKINLKKCFFSVLELPLAGWSNLGIIPEFQKVGAVSNAKIQTNVTEVRGFIELVNYVYNLYQVMLN